MDLSTVISMAKQNQKEAIGQKKFGYSTALQPPKKLERTVNPAAVKAFLNRKKEIEKIREEENMQKKRELEKLREDKKHTRKAKAMATRTKDNLQVYRGEDYLGRNKEKNNKEVVLTPEQDMLHKAFMKKISSEKVVASDDERFDERNGAQKPHKMSRKKEKRIEKAREAAKMNFNDLLNLAQAQAKKPVDNNLSSSDDDDSSEDSSDDAATPEERYERERQKRKKLEAKLKAMKGLKRKADSSHSSQHPFKIAKLDKGLSDDAKKAQVKALMLKFKSKSGKQEASDRSVERPKEIRQSRNASHDNKKQRPLTDKTSSEHRRDPKYRSTAKSTEVRPSHSAVNLKTSSVRKQESTLSKSDVAPDRRKALPPPKNGMSCNSKPTVITKTPKSQPPLKQNRPKIIKKAPNPYAELMEKAKSNNQKSSPPCTLSVQSTMVRTNYPGVSLTDPKKPVYGKPKAPTRAMLEEYRRRALHGPPTHQARYRTLRDECSDDDDEYDSDMDGFIDDDEDESVTNPNSISAQIGAIFKYDKTKYGRESEYELSKMDASYKDIEREEKRSLRIAQQEDALEAKRLEEEEARKKKRKR